jgi:hypothetical protein
MNGCLMIFGIIFLILFVLFIAFIVKLLKNSKDSSWSGKVVDKKISTSEDMDSGQESTNYVLVVDTQERKGMNVAVAKGLYDDCQIGDTLEKPKGTLIPHKA